MPKSLAYVFGTLRVFDNQELWQMRQCKDEDCERCDCEWATIGAHDFDEDCCCVVCGFDAAEWYWWKNNTYEGRSVDAKMPRCKPNEATAGGCSCVTR